MNDIGAEAERASKLAVALGGLLPGSATIPAGDGGVQQIEAHDPGFDATHLLAHAEEVRQAVITALQTKDPRPLHRFVGPSLYPALAGQVAGTGPATVDTSPTASDSKIVTAHSDASYDTVVVRITTAARSTDWTFQRSAKLTSSATTETHCPSCGAPLTFDDNGACAYCHNPLNVADLDWVLVRIEDAAPGVSVHGGTFTFSAGGGAFQGTIQMGDLSDRLAQTEVAAARAGRAGMWIGIVVTVLVVAGVGGGIIAAVSSGTNHVRSALRSVTPPAAPAPGGPTARDLSARLTLNGGVNLAPSDINSDEFLVNGLPPGQCPGAQDAIRSLVVNVTFDSGAKLTGAFTPAKPIAVGATGDFASGGSAALHFTGPTQATTDDQSWVMPPGQAGAVTVQPTAQGGTLKWQGFAAAETDHNNSGDLSGLLTWTCS